MSFLHNQYIELLEDVFSANKAVGGVGAFLKSPSGKPTVILRHDVDRRVGNSRMLAEIEAAYGVCSTYYFRASSAGVFPFDSIKYIARLGHEIGYHYEDLSATRGDVGAAVQRFEFNLDALRSVAECITVSMHGAPLSRHHNQDLFQHVDVARCGILGDAVSTVAPYDPFYLTDTGGAWLAATSNLRDRVGTSWPSGALPSDRPAFREFVSSVSKPLYISTHPERWSKGLLGYAYIRCLDVGTNVLKRGVRLLRSGGSL